MASGRIFWSEVSGGAKGRLFWSSVEPGAPELFGRIFWSSVEAEAPAFLVGRIFWSEVGAAAPSAVYTLTAEAGAYTMTWAGSVGQVVLDAEPAAYTMTAQEATLTVSAPPDTTAADVWSYVMPNGLTAAQVFCELHKIHGLTAGAPLAVTSATRTAGDISQSISDSAGVVTVTRN